MSALPKPTEPLSVKITTGPHGRATTMEIEGQPVTKARSFTLHADCDGATTLTVEYINVQVEVDALVEETAFNAENKAYRRVRLAETDETTESGRLVAKRGTPYTHRAPTNEGVGDLPQTGSACCICGGLARGWSLPCCSDPRHDRCEAHRYPCEGNDC